MGTLSQVLSLGYNELSNQLNTGSEYTTLRDYQHAIRIFRPNNNSLMPKAKNWFHIFFQVNPAVSAIVNTQLATAVSTNRINWNANNLNILGVLAKTTKLPAFRFEVKKANQYNKWSLTQTKMSYEPIEVSFWDDTIDMIRGFWYAYYQYNIQDPRFVNFQMSQTQGIPIPFQWAQSNGNTSYLYSTPSNWGANYGLDTVDSVGGQLNRTTPFFDSIRIYQFDHQTTSSGPEYIEYVLVNPIISSFDHDTVDFSASDFMQNRMTIDYETVLYNSGFINNDEIASWEAVLQRFFDTTPSPLTGTNPAGNSTQLAGVESVATLAEEVTELGLNTGQATVSTVLTQAIGTSMAIQDASNESQQNTFIAVPTVVSGYGTSGNPPSVPGA